MKNLMKPSKQKITIASLLINLFLVAVVVGCGNKPTRDVEEFKPDPSNGDVSYVNNASNENLLAITLGDDLIVQTKNVHCEGKFKNDKRKYHNEAGEVIREVSYTDSGFKLKKGEDLVAKIKWDYPDKIKLGRNEEVIPAWELKHKADRVELDFSDSDLYFINWSAINNNELIHDSFKFFGFQNSITPGIMLISELETLDQAIIMAELLKKGK